MNEVVIYERGCAVIIRQEETGRWRCYFPMGIMAGGESAGVATWPTLDDAIRHGAGVVKVWLRNVRRESGWTG